MCVPTVERQTLCTLQQDQTHVTLKLESLGIIEYYPEYYTEELSRVNESYM